MFFNDKLLKCCLHLDPLTIVIVLQVDLFPTNVRYVHVAKNGLYLLNNFSPKKHCNVGMTQQ